MSYSTGINYFYDFLGLDSGNFRVFYDFSAASHSSTRINSIPLANSGYSGTAGLIASQNGSGLFSSVSNRIKISNVSQNDFSSDYSFLFKFRPAVNQDGILFSSLTGSAFKSGFNIGVNQSNYLYFHYYDNQGPVYLTYQKPLPETAIVGVNISQNNIGLNCYNSNTKQLESKDFFIDSQYLLFSDQWHLGSSVLSGQPANPFSGFYGGFLAFNQSLSKNTMTRLVSGFYAYPGVNPAVSGQLVSSGIIGYGQSGINSVLTGFGVSYSGFKSGNCSVTYPVFNISNLSGASSSGLFPIYGPITGNYEITPASTGILIDYNRFNELGYDSVTYQWRELSGFSTEIYSATGLSYTNYNKFGIFDIVAGDFSSDSFYPSGNCNVYLNGIGQYESGFQVTGQFFNSGKSGIADFYVENQYFNFKEDVFSSDTLIYDSNLQQNRPIINLSGSTIIPNIPAGFTNLYLNGQKLVSGEDYSASGTSFVLNNYFSAISSGWRALVTSGYTLDFKRETGTNSFYRRQKFLPNSTSYFLNGVRHPTEHFVEHSWLSPLSGRYIFAENLDLINNSEINDWI